MNVRVELTEDEVSELVKKRIQSQFPNTRLVSDSVLFESKIVVKPTEPDPETPPDTKPEEPAGETPVEAVQAEKAEEVKWESASIRVVCELTTAEKKTE